MKKISINFEVADRFCTEPIKDMIYFVAKKVEFHVNGFNYHATIINKDSTIIEMSERDIEEYNKELDINMCKWTTQEVGNNYIGCLIINTYKRKDQYFYDYFTLSLDERVRYGQCILDEISNINKKLEVLYEAELISQEKYSEHLVEITQMRDDYYARAMK